MAEGGFLVKFDGKEVTRCFAVSFDHDMHEFVINGNDKRELSPDIKRITIEIEKS